MTCPECGSTKKPDYRKPVMVSLEPYRDEWAQRWIYTCYDCGTSFVINHYDPN